MQVGKRSLYRSLQRLQSLRHQIVYVMMCKECQWCRSACRASWWPASSMLRMAWIQRRCASAAFTSALSFTQLCVPLLPHFILSAVWDAVPYVEVTNASEPIP